MVGALDLVPESACRLEQVGSRQRFHVELSGARRTLSWRRLLKLVPHENAALPPGANPALESRIAPQVVQATVPATTHEGPFKTAIEKIEQIYKGRSDEDSASDADVGVHDKSTTDVEEYYNTDDSFIDDGELDEYFGVDKTKTKHTGFFINYGKIESVNEGQDSDVKSIKRKRKDEQEGGVKRLKSKKSSKANEGTKPAMLSAKPDAVKEPLAERNNGLTIDLNKSGDVKVPSKDASPVKKGPPKCSYLDRAIQDLEKEVAKLCPPTPENQEIENKVKKLPREVKTRLAKVARLAQKQKKMTEEFCQGLMKILGHLISFKVLKKHMKEMVELGISAQMEKQSKIDLMKKEIVEMVKSRIKEETCNWTDGEENRDRYCWDNETEDRICDLYEFYVEGMDEHKGVPSRKFYHEIAELWPEGWMDSNGIKCAILRARDRRKEAMKQARVEERKRKKSEKSSELKKRPSEEQQQTKKVDKINLAQGYNTLAQGYYTLAQVFTSSNLVIINGTGL